MLLLLEQLEGADAWAGIGIMVALLYVALNASRIANWVFSKREDESE